MLSSICASHCCLGLRKVPVAVLAALNLLSIATLAAKRFAAGTAPRLAADLADGLTIVLASRLWSWSPASGGQSAKPARYYAGIPTPDAGSTAPD